MSALRWIETERGWVNLERVDAFVAEENTDGLYRVLVYNGANSEVVRGAGFGTRDGAKTFIKGLLESVSDTESGDGPAWAPRWPHPAPSEPPQPGVRTMNLLESDDPDVPRPDPTRVTDGYGTTLPPR